MLKYLCFTALASLATLAQAAEQPVSIPVGDKTIAGILTLPDGVDHPPVVLMLHGFTGQKDEFPIAGTQTGLFTFMADELSKAGIASLRIDFAGSGESSGAWEDTTFTGQTQDAIDAFDWLQTQASVDGQRVGVLGYSQGGLVGAQLAGARPEAKALVLWAPVTNPLATYSTIMGADKIAAGLAAGDEDKITADLSWGGQTTLKGKFFHEIPLMSAAGAIASYPGPLRVIVGAKETIVTPQPIAGNQLLKYHVGPEDLVLLDSDHDFGAETSDAIAKADLAPKTVEWFTSNF
ncbi:alpha/beta hydrolase family protein [Fuscibacter oryzae]|uniref:Alpha/beta fold hydrolase n=1 Tax=Fuscibacter oryzae TaxID=2803939 RepID=A0A8J7MRZ7_9RHOB|nr:alpha/beta fold hydrolase [Fuscibacter oryzae]MBL4929442.1 alpha/beta fold hydrolase [Fuscibacter oryzae]